MTIVIALLLFGIIILIHEFGHFLLAKKNGVTVHEFSIGMGQKFIAEKKMALNTHLEYCQLVAM